MHQKQILQRHVELESILGVGSLDRLSDGDYELAISGAPAEVVAKFPDGNAEGMTWDAIRGMIDEGLIVAISPALSSHNKHRFVMKYGQGPNFDKALKSC